MGELLTDVQCAVPGERRAGSAAEWAPASVRLVLHPVGPLPARVYWRRRLIVLAVLVATLVASIWGGVLLLAGGMGASDAGAQEPTRAAARTPALEQVVPPLTAVRTPVPPEPTPAAPEEPASESSPAPQAAEPGGSCTDDMLSIEVRTPGSAAVGAKPVFELIVVNTSTGPCTRELDKGLQELILLDARGVRVWGSNDCFPESGADLRTLAPGEVVVFPVLWGGRTSEPECSAERTAPAAGAYAVRGRLDTKISPDTPFTLT